jgi:hypothetical protein
MASQLSRSRPAGTVRVAVAQTAPELGANQKNLNQVIEWLGEAAAEGARLVVFPECALSGYLLDDLNELERFAEPVPGPAIRRLAEACARQQVYTVVGLLERGAEAIYNSAVLVGPDGLIACYRKAHLPGLGLDRLVAHGDTPFAVRENPHRPDRHGHLLRHPLSGAGTPASLAGRRHHRLSLQLARGRAGSASFYDSGRLDAGPRP